ncbi:MAG: PfkB family carbohydrate kinase [Armatimonadota bacterium]|nr:PfkB family carbohydrate kinase [bacterium]MDW8319939.1 PfkB family carbohydrate kinase [Armatimonadota bacterium]
MTEERLRQILDRFPDQRVLVVGDFFLDHYLLIDRAISETSLETGLEAYQVVEVRNSPGAGGTVANNLRALQIQTYAITVIGQDGLGYDLLHELRVRGVSVDGVLQHPKRFTPTYTKPMVRELDGRIHEVNRLDIKNRQVLEPEWEERVIALLRDFVPEMDGVIVADQVEERNCGVVTDRVREEICQLAQSYPQKVFLADSRARIGEYYNLFVKPNQREAIRVFQPEWEGTCTLQEAREVGVRLSKRTGKPVFLTIGEQGVLVVDDERVNHVPAVPVTGEIDIVGAGDSTSAGTVSALCSGANLVEAAQVGQLVASITIQQIGTTGTATREQVLRRLGEAKGWGWTV